MGGGNAGSGFGHFFGHEALDLANHERLVVIDAGTPALALMVAGHALNVRERIGGGDDPPRQLEIAPGHGVEIPGNVLFRRTARHAGYGGAVEARERAFCLDRNVGEPFLVVPAVLAEDSRRIADEVGETGIAGDRRSALLPFGYGVGPGLAHLGTQRVEVLVQPPVTAGLEDVGGHGDGTEAASQRVRHVERIHPGGEGDVQLPVEFLLEAFGEVDADGVQGSAAHVNHALAAGQVLLFVGGFERVGQLEPEGYARRFGGCGEVADDGHAVVVFEVVPEGFVGNAYVIAELRIQDVAQAFWAEQGGVQLDGRVVLAFGDEIAADAFHFVGRA